MRRSGSQPFINPAYVSQPDSSKRLGSFSDKFQEQPSFELDMLNDELNTLEAHITEVRNTVKDMKMKELERIFKEFISHSYESRYRAPPEIVTSALVGEEHSLVDLSKLFNKDRNYLANKI